MILVTDRHCTCKSLLLLLFSFLLELTMTLATTLNPMTTAVRRSYELKPKAPVPPGQSADRLN